MVEMFYEAESAKSKAQPGAAGMVPADMGLAG